jgi:hypothetical protein
MTKDLKDKAISIKGKAYVQVKDRILFLSSEQEQDYSISTEYEYFNERKMWVVKATLNLRGNIYTGLAQEVESDDYKQVNHSSALENCETSAVGRACAMAGIGVLDSIASVDEMNKAGNRQARQNVPMITLTAAYDSKDAIKAIDGARWNGEAKKWMVPDTKENRATALNIKGVTAAVDSEGVMIDVDKVKAEADKDVKEIVDNDLPF